MLLDKDTNPTKSIYFIGSRIIDLLKESRFSSLDINIAFGRLNQNATKQDRISFDYFLLALDWLFLLDVVEVTSAGDIQRCF